MYKERRESVVESSKSLEPSFQQFGTVNATMSGSLRFDKDPVVWSAGEVPLSSHTAIILAIYRQRWTHSNIRHSTLLHVNITDICTFYKAEIQTGAVYIGSYIVWYRNYVHVLSMGAHTVSGLSQDSENTHN